MKLERATVIAHKIVAALQPLCERIEIAGSVRRARPEVNDIDLVLLPRPGQTAAIKARCRERCAQVSDGDQNSIFRLQLPDLTQLQIDLFFARPASADLFDTTPGNFGSILLCRTGSKEHNIWIVEHAKRLALEWSPYRGVVDAAGRVIASETEAEIFRALDLNFIPPEGRER